MTVSSPKYSVVLNQTVTKQAVYLVLSSAHLRSVACRGGGGLAHTKLQNANSHYCGETSSMNMNISIGYFEMPPPVSFHTLVDGHYRMQHCCGDTSSMNMNIDYLNASTPVSFHIYVDSLCTSM